MNGQLFAPAFAMTLHQGDAHAKKNPFLFGTLRIPTLTFKFSSAKRFPMALSISEA